MELQIIEQSEKLTHVALAGRLDVVGVETLGREFDAQVGARGVSAVVDISGISFLASMGLGLLLRNATILSRAGSKLVVLKPSELVEDVLRIAGLDQVTPVVHDLDEALALVSRPED